ncbi:hypothetical protein H009_17863 [Agrobacterium tumefaciens str. Cherry 2E-2-2]|uniref:T6SS Transcription factor RovC-like DNA binding domain-containing protein n=1 Tax=Agrobacterium deltaense Zutra 3/1 TaxID=1183427 RepID=A0A1S7R729_9HYPH|nr:DUF2285 domain-containing protein [Agrobacterium deltaense]EMS96353.1 hypothetical protein H009_17863 [Agrobacterium tumefaciens str. Cherry 2E-2-2]CUX47983.1 conserved hypothetical protein [Agrobacterium deltaense Zutra 3/1]
MQEGSDGLYLLASAGSDLKVWLPRGDLPVKGAFVVPIDDHLDIRLHNLRRALRWLKREPLGPVLRRQGLSNFHRHRFVRMLRAVDGLRAGASRREIASSLFSRDVRSLSAIEWKNTSERRQLARLLAEANEYIQGGYLRILTGMRTRGHLFVGPDRGGSRAGGQVGK